MICWSASTRTPWSVRSRQPVIGYEQKSEGEYRERNVGGGGKGGEIEQRLWLDPQHR